MGAFGRLLIQYWGGDIDAYDGNVRSESNPNPKKTKEDLLEEDKERLLMISGACNDIVSKGENMLRQISNDNVLHTFNTDEYMEKYVKWRSQFLKKLEE